MSKLIALLRKEIGYTERSGGYTKFGNWYNTVEHDSDYSDQPWCDMFLSWAAHKLGYDQWFGQSAYTVGHARWFKKQGAWGHKPAPGAVVFYDWSGGNSIRGIDHVGIVTSVRGRTIHTIEGNVDGRFARQKVRDQSSVVGYGYPEKILKRLDAQSSTLQDVAEQVSAFIPEPAPEAEPTVTLASLPVAVVRSLPVEGVSSLDAQALVTPALLVALGIAYVKSRRLRPAPATGYAGRHRRSFHATP